jgi:hypothetical protein
MMIDPRVALKPTDRQLHQFGWIALFGFPLAALLLRLQFGLPPVAFWTLVGLGAVSGACAALRLLRAIRPIYLLMVLLALPLGLIIGNVLLALIYFGMFTPVALWFRAIGRDRLRRKLDPSASTYWISRGAPRDLKSYLKLH